MDQLERAVRDGLKVALTRRGTEYIVTALRLTTVDRREALVGRLPMTGEELAFRLDQIDSLPGHRLSPVAVLHLDESCLGNGREGENPGGGGGLIESRTRGGRIERRDFYIHEPATTNNRMALAGAAEALRLLGAEGRRG